MDNNKTAPAEYREFTDLFDGIKITFRDYFTDSIVLIRLDNNFARANGYSSMDDIHSLLPDIKQYDWIDSKSLELIGAYQDTHKNNFLIN